MSCDLGAKAAPQHSSVATDPLYEGPALLLEFVHGRDHATNHTGRCRAFVAGRCEQEPRRWARDFLVPMSMLFPVDRSWFLCVNLHRAAGLARIPVACIDVEQVQAATVHR